MGQLMPPSIDRKRHAQPVLFQQCSDCSGCDQRDNRVQTWICMSKFQVQAIERCKVLLCVESFSALFQRRGFTIKIFGWG